MSSASSPLLASVWEGQTARYVYLAILSTYIWDWVLSLSDEFAAIRRCRSWSTILAYLLSRAGVAGSMVINFMIPTTPIAHCNSIFHLGAVLGSVASGASSFLFLYRIRAVYERSTVITAVFSALWLAVAISGAAFIFLASSTITPGLRRQCVVNKLGPESMFVLWVKGAYDTAVFAAISHRMASISKAKCVSGSATSPWSRARGKGLSQLCRDILQDGQLYYFASVVTTLFAAIVIMLPINVGWRMTLSESGFPLDSSMACRIFRRVLLGGQNEEAEPGSSAPVLLTTVMAEPDYLYDDHEMGRDDSRALATL